MLQNCLENSRCGFLFSRGPMTSREKERLSESKRDRRRGTLACLFHCVCRSLLSGTGYTCKANERH